MSSVTPTNSTSADTPPLATAQPWVTCGISRAQWHRLYSAGRTPLAIRLGKRKPVFLIGELESWLRAGAPSRDVWEKMKQSESRR